MREAELQAQIRAVLCQANSPLRVWRNNVGRLPTPDGKGWVEYGLGKGSADLIGLIEGRGTFVGVEIKLPKRYQSVDQKLWQKTIQNYGGVAVVVKSVEEANAFVEELRRGTT